MYIVVNKHNVVKTYGMYGEYSYSSTPGPLYPKWKRPRYPLDKRLGGPRSRSGRDGENKSFHCSCWKSKPGRPASSLVTKLINLLRLQNILRNRSKVIPDSKECD
jgi:hypothetical protein